MGQGVKGREITLFQFIAVQINTPNLSVKNKNWFICSLFLIWAGLSWMFFLLVWPVVTCVVVFSWWVSWGLESFGTLRILNLSLAIHNIVSGPLSLCTLPQAK